MSTNPSRGTWDWTELQGVPIPLSTISRAKKDKDGSYDVQKLRHHLGRQQGHKINLFRRSYATNCAYATDSRWGEEEDIKTFLKSKGRSTSRVAFKNPLVQPMLTRLRGAADNISVSPIAETATQFAITRKEQDLARALAMSLAARGNKAVADAFAPMGISPDEEKTRAFHENHYQDELIVAINSLMNMVSSINEMDGFKREIAKSIALSGLAAWHFVPHGHHIVPELCEPDEVGWDPAAVRPDFADGQYVYHCPLMGLAQLAERFNISEKLMTVLEKNSEGEFTSEAGWPDGMPRVVTGYYRDTDYVYRGYVMEDGEPTYVTIDEPDPDSRDGKPKYTEKDLIDPPENQWTATWSRSEWDLKRQRRAIERIRFCSFIPWEYLPGHIRDGKTYAERKSAKNYDRFAGADACCSTGDLVLDWGVYELQEANPDDTNLKGFPLKFATWTVIAGHVIAPLTAAISPQRVMNQVTSDLMYRLRKAGHNSPAIDTDALAGSTMSEADIMFALKEGDPINLKGALVGGLQNAVRDIDTSPSTSFYNAFTLIPQIKQMAEASVGVFEQNYGAPGSPNQLVGTLQLQLQQAGVMQQPFYAAIADLYRQAYRFIAQAGKQFYTRRPWILRQMVGDIGYDVLNLCRDLQNEQFRIDIDLTINTKEMRQMVDTQIIPMRMQLGLLDAATAANLFGRATTEDVNRACRKFAKDQAQAAMMQQEQMQQQQFMQGLAMEEQAIQDEERDLSALQTKAETEQMKAQQKLQQPMQVALAEHLKPQEPTQPSIPA